MAKPYYLIDFENVQPRALDRLRPGEARIKVFLGQHQNRLMLELVQALQPFGADAEYIQITGSGPDAVDFHIAFYIGRLAAAEPGASFTIVSKDRGFDPLVAHLNALGIGCRRESEIPGAAGATTKPAAPVAKKAAKAAKKAVAKKAAAKAAAASAPATPTAAKGTSTRTRTADVVKRLQKSSKPARLSTLRSSIQSWFKPELDDKAVEAVIESLQAAGKINVAGTRVTYALD